MVASTIVRICSAQIASVWDDPEKTLEKIAPFVSHAAASGAGLIAFPEQFATGWDPSSGTHTQDSSGDIVSELTELAKKHSIAILGSFRERGSPLPKNTAIVIGKDGKVLARYAKMHLFTPGGENNGFMPGAGPATFQLGPLTCGLAICYDLRFPELFRLYAKEGVQAMFVPAAWPGSRMRPWELFITARACENQMYVCGINTTGTTPVENYTGNSMTADPYGSVISRANNAEQLLFSDLDVSVVARARADFPVAKDCRRDIYLAISGRKE